MPLYEYRCESCDHSFEILQRIGDGADGLACPECGEAGVEKRWSTFSGTVAGRTAPAPAPAGGCCRGGLT